MGRYQELDHTADLKLKIWGKDLKDLFATAAQGLVAQITDLGKISPEEESRVELEADNVEALLISWLNEILYLFFGEGRLCSSFQFEEITPTRLKARLRGEQYNRSKHPLYQEIKAATYHQLHLRRKDEGWEAQVVFDI